MVEYKCNRCGYITNLKGNIKHHLNRKNICPPLLEDISIDEMKFMYGFEITTKIPQNTTILHTNPQNEHTKIPQKTTKNHNFSTILPQKTTLANKETCLYCKRTFSRYDSLKRHLNTCKEKHFEESSIIKKKDNEIQELKEMVEKLLMESKGNTNITNNNTNNTTNNTTNNIININNYGDENTKYITGDYILQLLKNRPAKTIPELIRYTHFNEAHPENQNIKITNKKAPYVKVRKNDKWELQDKEETISDLIDRQQVHLIDENIEKKIEMKCSNTEKVNINRCNELYNEEDKNYMKRLYNESELIILNNS